VICRRSTVRAADGSGSTCETGDEPPGTKLAIGTEGHFVKARERRSAGVEVITSRTSLTGTATQQMRLRR
jgi:hypothetical protein